MCCPPVVRGVRVLSSHHHQDLSQQRYGVFPRRPTRMEVGLKSLKVAELKKILTDNGLDDKGKKEELVAVHPTSPLACILAKRRLPIPPTMLRGGFCHGRGPRCFMVHQTLRVATATPWWRGKRICRCLGGPLCRGVLSFSTCGPPKRGHRWRALPCPPPPCPRRAVRLTLSRAPLSASSKLALMPTGRRLVPLPLLLLLLPVVLKHHSFRPLPASASSFYVSHFELEQF